MTESVQVEGVERLESTLHRFARQLPGVAPESAARTIGGEAVVRVPKRTGRLAGSFQGTAGAGVVRLSFGAAYAAPIHFGVAARAGLRGPHNIRATPYLFGAINSTQPTWAGEYRQQVESLLDQVKGA